jgi:hypothetical protein
MDLERSFIGPCSFAFYKNRFLILFEKTLQKLLKSYNLLRDETHKARQNSKTSSLPKQTPPNNCIKRRQLALSATTSPWKKVSPTKNRKLLAEFTRRGSRDQVLLVEHPVFDADERRTSRFTSCSRFKWI